MANIDNLPSQEVLEAREAGIARVPSPPVEELPPGGGKWPVPHHLTKIGIINQIARAYRWTYDEALKDSRVNAVRMLNDLVIRDALTSRIIPTVQLGWHLEPQDETDPEQVKAAAKLEQIIRKTPRLQDLHQSLMMATWYGRQGAALIYEWDNSHPDGEQRLVIRNHRPINGDSLVAHWSGDWGMLVNGLYDGPKVQSERGYEHFFNAKEKEAVIIHTHCPEDADYYEPELAGQIKGSGLRGHIYWYWWIKSNFLALLSDYAERFANGIWEAGYEKSNPDGKQEMEDALAAYRSDRILLVPKDVDGKTAYTLRIHEVGTATPQFILEMITYLEGYIKRYITGSSIDESQNIGGDGAAVFEDRVTRNVKFDAVRLGETYTQELLPVLTKYNCGPRVPPPRWVFDTESSNASEIIGYAERIKSLGGDIDLGHLNKVAGLPTPTVGDNIASQIQPMSPVAVTNQPQGVPMVTPSATVPQDQTQQMQQAPQQPMVTNDMQNSGQ